MSSAPGTRYQSLDHWRGFAALWVLLFHANRGLPDAGPAWLGGFITSGWLGVQVFFAISGYCIAERAAREYRLGGSVLRFTLDRLLRIYPPYWAALLVTLLLNLAGALAKGGSVLAPSVFPHTAAEWFATVLVIEPWLEIPSFMLVAWTLTYEVAFYVLTAIGLGLALRTRHPWTGFAWGGLLLAASLLPAARAWLPALALWPNFVVGGIVWLSCQVVRSVPARLSVGTLALGAVYLGLWLQPGGPAYSLVFACACAWLLLVLQPGDARLAGFRPLHWLGWVGTFSYSLYLVHAPVVGKLVNLIDRWPLLAGHRFPVIAGSSLVTVAGAWLFYRVIEVRSEAFRRARLLPVPRP